MLNSIHIPLKLDFSSNSLKTLIIVNKSPISQFLSHPILCLLFDPTSSTSLMHWLLSYLTLIPSILTLSYSTHLNPSFALFFSFFSSSLTTRHQSIPTHPNLLPKNYIRISVLPAHLPTPQCGLIVQKYEIVSTISHIYI